jgi:hypothetical protein
MEEKTYLVHSHCSNCGAGGKEKLPFGTGRSGVFQCENCGCLDKRYTPVPTIRVL